MCENAWLFYMTIMILTAMRRSAESCWTNPLPPSPDCSLIDGEIRFFHLYEFTGHHIFIRTLFLGFTNADQGLSPLQQLTQKDGTQRIQYRSVIVNDLVAVKCKSFTNQFQATSVKSNRLFIHYK